MKSTTWVEWDFFGGILVQHYCPGCCELIHMQFVDYRKGDEPPPQPKSIHCSCGKRVKQQESWRAELPNHSPYGRPVEGLYWF